MARRALFEAAGAGSRTGDAAPISPRRAIADVSPRHVLIRITVALTFVLGIAYVTWRWVDSVNWSVWWIAVPLVLAETYSLIDSFLFGVTVWRMKKRGEPPMPATQVTVDVLITTYNEPVEMVMETGLAAKAIRYPHRTWILDDGARPEMAAAAEQVGIGYLLRSEDWTGRPRHAKAGNLNNALMALDGEFLLILDADQIPDPKILDRTLGYFTDDRVALVQTPQWFSNVTKSDPLGSQAPLFYGPIQRGKDGWNAAFFCGSNAVLRREALMQLGVVRYVQETERAVSEGLRRADAALAKAGRTTPNSATTLQSALAAVRSAAAMARAAVAAGEPLSRVTYNFQRNCHPTAAGRRRWRKSMTRPCGGSPNATGPLSAPWSRFGTCSAHSTWTGRTRRRPSCRWQPSR